MALKDDVVAALKGVIDPLGDGDIATTGRAAGLVVKDDGIVGLVLSVDGLDRVAAERLQAAVEVAVNRVAGVNAARIILTADRGAAPAQGAQPVAPTVAGIRKLIAVASGKGGVGKSTVAANLAVALARAGHAVGLLDADIYGPSVPTLMGIEGRARLEGNRLQPAVAHGIKALSMGMMTDPKKAIVWRGPMASSALVQMVEQADWGVLDVLIIDMPPGTGDIHLTLSQKIPVTGAIIVTTPQDIALLDARKGLKMFEKVGIPILGVVENMAIHVCSQCGHAEHIFGEGGGARMSADFGVEYLGGLPLDIRIREQTDSGRPTVVAEPDGAIAAAYRQIARRMAVKVAETAKDMSSKFPSIVVQNT